jgi:hypothetical protein
MTDVQWTYEILLFVKHVNDRNFEVVLDKDRIVLKNTVSHVQETFLSLSSAYSYVNGYSAAMDLGKGK